MYKTLFAAVLLLPMFALAQQSKATLAPPATFPSPLIVAKGKLLNQSAPISTTTIFTPTQTGLYRLSVYGTVTLSNPSSINYWYYTFNWSDDAGPENSGGILFWQSSNITPYAYAYNNAYWPGNVTVFEAVADVPFTYSVSGTADGSKYSLYWAIERLE